MNYKAVEVIWIFLAGGRDGTDGRTGIEGSIRGPPLVFVVVFIMKGFTW